MILLDTNIISELMRPEPNQAVIEWLDEQVAEQLFLPAIAIAKAEIETGIAILDDGKRKQSLLKAAEFIFINFTNRFYHSMLRLPVIMRASLLLQKNKVVL